MSDGMVLSGGWLRFLVLDVLVSWDLWLTEPRPSAECHQDIVNRWRKSSDMA